MPNTNNSNSATLSALDSRSAATKATQARSWGSGITDFGLLFIVCICLYFFKLGAVGIIDPGDGYYTETAREMVDTGDYITPQLNYQMYFSKPVFMYWLISSAYHMFGVCEFAARFWSATFAMLLVVAVYWAVRGLAGRRAGVISGLVLATTPAIAIYARIAQIDMVFSSLLGIALCALVSTVAAERRATWVLFYAVLGVAILTKGPAALMFFGLTGLTYLAARRPGKEEFFKLIKQLHLVAGPLLMLAVAAPWFICVGVATQWLWPRVFFLFENFGRFNGETNYAAPKIWFFLPVLGYSFLPWLVFLPPALKQAFAGKKLLAQSNAAVGATTAGSQSDSASIDAQAASADKRQRGMLVFACWASAVFVFMSLSRTQLSYYILPMYTGAAAIVGLLLDQYITRFRATGEKSSWYAVVSPLAALVGAAGGIGGLVYIMRFEALPAGLRAMGMAGCAALLLGTALQAFVGRKNLEKGIYMLIAACIFSCALLAPVGYHIGWENANGDLQRLLGRTNGTLKQLAFYKSFNPSAMFYCRRPIDFLFDKRLFLKTDNMAGTRDYRMYCLVQDKDVKDLLELYGDRMTLMDKEGRWSKYEMHNLTPHHQEPLWMLYKYCYENLVKEKDKFGPVGVPYGAGVPIRHHH